MQAPAASPAPPGSRLTIARPDDWHLHVRDGAGLASVVPHSAAVFGRAVIMPNLVPPVRSVDDAAAYRARVLAAVAPPPSTPSSSSSSSSFQPRMALYLTQATSPADVRAAAAAGFVHGYKLYPAGATTNSDAGVTDIPALAPTLAALAEAGLPLMVHGEATAADVDPFDREAEFVARVLAPLVDAHPTLKVVMEHVTTAEGVAFVAGAREGVAATVTPQHMTLNRSALFAGGLRPHAYCLPILKRERHRAAVAAAAMGGSGRFFLGTDSAPHPRAAKECACGCAGLFSAPVALPLYAAAFEAAGALDALEGFASLAGAAFYGLPAPTDTVTLVRDEWTVPAEYDFGDGTVVPMAAGETLRWRVE